MPSQTSSQGSEGEVGASPADAGRAAGADAPETVSASRPVGSIPDAGHTPGLWFIDGESAADSPPALVVATQDAVIAAVYGDLRADEPETVANANLIAAAPELLEALKAFVFYDEDDDDNGVQMMVNYDHALTLAKAAISKALGQHLGGEGL